MNTPERLTHFSFEGTEAEVIFTETQRVKDGVKCDIYRFSGDTSRDLAIVRVAQGFKTPLQRVLQGTKTIEVFRSGAGTLSITSESGNTTRTTFNAGTPDDGTYVEIGQIMQWTADQGSDLTYYEICEPPYQDGRFEDLPE